MRRLMFLLSLTTFVYIGESQSVWTSIVDNEADPSGKVKCTGIINHLIDSLSGRGGGTLFFPAGNYLTGPIVMKSNITLYLDAGAVIHFSDDFDDYLPMVQSRWEDVRVINFKSQIYAYQCENIAIRGDGHFEGHGKKWWDFMYKVNADPSTITKWQEIFKKENEKLLSWNSYIRSKNNFLRPPMITTYECSNVLIENVSFSNPPFWTIMPAFSDNVIITGITIENPGSSPNTDGIDPSSCRNVHISNCHITVGDDCIVIKSGRDEDGRDAGKSTENVTITNCTMLEGHGGVVIGSEMSGSIRRVTISNCVFQGTDRGIRIKTMRGRGGIVEDIRVSNITMYDMVNEGVLITLRYQDTSPEPLSDRTPEVKNVHLSNISICGAERPIALYGLSERDVSQISFNDIQMFSKRGILLENCAEISFHDIKMEISEGPLLEARDSEKITWDLVSASAPLNEIPVMKLINCQDIRISNCYQADKIPVYISEDESSEYIYIMNNIFPGTAHLHANKGKHIVIQNNITAN